MTLADKIVVLQAGRIEQVGSPRTLYERPDNLFVAQFIGSPKMNVVPGGVTDSRFALQGQGGGPAPASAGGANRVGIRPEHIALTNPGEGHCNGKVEVAEYLGADVMLFVDCDPLGVMTVRHVGDTAVKPGEQVGLRFDEQRVHFFDGDGLAVGRA